MTIRSKLQTIRERYYYPGALIEHTPLFLEGVEFHHLVHVLRGKVGQPIAVVDGLGSLAEGFILSIDKKKASFELTSIYREPPPPLTCILAQALPRLNRLDFIVEKGTELGMQQLYLFPGENSERKTLAPAQIERLENILVAAMKQCGRLFLPKIKILPAIKQWQKNDFSLPLFFGDLSPQAPSFQQALLNSPAKKAIFCTGPESGFTADEEVFLRSCGAEGVKLHANVLRTDTASLVALALMTAT